MFDNISVKVINQQYYRPLIGRISSYPTHAPLPAPMPPWHHARPPAPCMPPVPRRHPRHHTHPLAPRMPPSTMHALSNTTHAPGTMHAPQHHAPPDTMHAPCHHAPPGTMHAPPRTMHATPTTTHAPTQHHACPPTPPVDRRSVNIGKEYFTLEVTYDPVLIHHDT